MDKAEAINRIKDHIRVHHIGEYPHIKIAEALSMEISALATDNNVGDKQIPTDKDTNVLTNADRIRAMTDEELMKFIEDTGIAGCPYPAMSCRASCQVCILDWLKQPAEVE